jgi:hypothetical protein
VVFVLCSSPFPDQVSVDDLRLVYSGFDRIYQKHVENKFDNIKGSDFKSLKERLLILRHLLVNNQDLDPEKRAELIRALLSDGNIHEAQKVLPNADKKKESGIIAKAWRIISGGQSSAESEKEVLKKEMKKIASNLSDSQFLLGLKSIDIEDLQPAIQEAETLAHTSLSSSIDSTVQKLTHDVLRMQQDNCEAEIRKEIHAKEARALNDALLSFIRDLNAKSAGRKAS